MRMRIPILILTCLFLAIPCEAEIFIVDDDGPADFNNIQAAIDDSNDGDVIVVFPGTYTGGGNRDIDFGGRAVTVTSVAPEDSYIVAATVIDCNGTEEDPHRGFYFHSGEDGNSVLQGFTIVNGKGWEDGGGIYCEPSSPTISNNIIRYNYANQGAGVCCRSSSATITNNTIRSNYAFDGTYYMAGGGILSTNDSSPTISNNIINWNYAGYGGGIYCRYSSLSQTITNNTISNNSAFGTGGGIYCPNTPALIANNIISGNWAQVQGGGISCPQSSLTIANNTITGNSASSGGGISCWAVCSPKITNCILWANTPNEIDVQPECVPIVTYCDVQGGWLGLGNIDAEPCFVDTEGGDYHLKSEGWRWHEEREVWTWDDMTSRCVDAGNPGSALGEEPLTIPRDPNNLWGQNLRINMGAYGGTAEASMPPYDWALLADLTNDGIVDGKDFAHQAEDWQKSGDQQPGDLNRDGTLDMNDAALLVDDWLKATTWH